MSVLYRNKEAACFLTKDKMPPQSRKLATKIYVLNIFIIQTIITTNLYPIRGSQLHESFFSIESYKVSNSHLNPINEGHFYTS